MISLTACGGGGNTTVDPPPSSTAAESTGITQVDAVISQWRSDAPAKMKAEAVKPETIEEHVYTSTASLNDVRKHFDALVSNGWVPVTRLNTSSGDGLVVLGFEHGNTSLVVGAIDMQKFGSSGTAVYTLKGSK
jgi:hypothetical protein